MRARLVLLFAFFAALVPLTAGCSLGPNVPDDAQLRCASDSDCPGGFLCRTDAERCVSIDRIADELLAFVVEPALERSPVSHAVGFETVAASFVLNARPVRGPSAFIDGELEVPCEAVEAEAGFGFRCALALSTDAELAEGFHALEVEATDAIGFDVRDSLRFELDITPPAIAPDTEALRLTPGPQSALSVLDALGLGGVAQLTFAATEALPGTPVVRAGEATFTLRQQIGLLYVYELEVSPGSPPDGEYVIEVDLVDLAGNAATDNPASALVVDATPPGEAAVDTPDAVIFFRAPWGNGLDDATPRFRAVGAPGAAEGRAFVRFTADADPDSLLLGQGEVNEDGGFDLELLPVDLPRAFVRVIDRAGNLGAPRAVRDIDWTATLGGKIAGRTAENPHALFAPGTFDEAALDTNIGAEAADVGALSGAGAAEARADRRFTQIDSRQNNFPLLARAAFAFHRGRGTLVTFGGFDPDNVLRNTDLMFELVGESWQPILASFRPPPDQAAMTYDTANDRLVLVGVSGTFAFEGNNWRFLGDFPAPRPTNNALTFDEAQQRAVALVEQAGALRTLVLEDDAWRELAPPPVDFPVLRPAVVGYDPASRRVVVYGGAQAQGFAGSGEIWALDGETWVEVGSGPPRELHALVHDGTRLLAVGGNASCEIFDCAGIASVDAFDGTTFSPTGDTGAFGVEQIVGFNPGKQRLEVYTGYFDLPPSIGAPPPFEDRLFVLDEAGFAEVAEQPAAVDPRDEGSAAYDRARDRVIIHGGFFSGFAATVLTDTWEIRGDSILQLGQSPDIRESPIAWDGAAVFAFDSQGLTMRIARSTLVTGAATPSPPQQPAIAFDPARNAALLFGGQRSAGGPTSETWTFNGTAFNQLAPTTSPPPRTRASMAVEPGGGRAIVFGGCETFCNGNTELTDTWAFDGTTWTELNTTPDLPLTDARLVAHDGRAAVVLLGNSGGALHMYELLADAWIPVDARTPLNLDAPTVGYDILADRVLLQGGFRDSAITEELFEWDGAPDARPAHMMRVDVGEAFLSDAAVLGSLTLRAIAGGRGFTGRDTSVPGVEVLAWAEGFESLGTSSDDVDTPAELVHVVTDPVQLQRFVKPNGTLFVAWAPANPNGVGDSAGRGARLVTEHLAVTLRYREP